MVTRYDGEIWYSCADGRLVKYEVYEELENDLKFYKEETERLGRLTVELYKQIDTLQPTALLDK